MTKLYDGLVADLFQNSMRQNPEVLALSFAIREEKRRIMEEALQTRTMSVIDDLPESILDILAVELRSPYYDQAYAIDAKREIIKRSLTWRCRAGTVSAMEELIEVIFGGGFVEEWYEFYPREGNIVPGEFDLAVDAPMRDPIEYMVEINRIIRQVKNTRSHLRRVMFWRKAITSIRPVAVITPYPSIIVRMDYDRTHGVDSGEFAVTLPGAYPSVTIRNSITHDMSAEAGPVAGTHEESIPHVTISNIIAENVTATAPGATGAIAESTSEIYI